MKYYFILLSILFSIYVSAQQKSNSKKASFQINSPEPTDSSSDIAYHTPSKDTLFLANDNFGKLLYRVWLMDSTYKGKNPTIIFVNNVTTIKKKREYKKR